MSDYGNWDLFPPMLNHVHSTVYYKLHVLVFSLILAPSDLLEKVNLAACCVTHP